MRDYSKKEMFDGERAAIIECTTMGVIQNLISQIEGYMREYPGKEEDEAFAGD